MEEQRAWSFWWSALAKMRRNEGAYATKSDRGRSLFLSKALNALC